MQANAGKGPKPGRSRRGIVPRLMILAVAALAWGCASAPPPSPVPCERVGLEPAPPWTASAAWSAGEDEMVLVDPGSRGLATYGRDGRRLSEVPLDAVELDFGEPMRLERTEDGYLLIGKTQVIELDESLAVVRRRRPLAALEERGVEDGSFNDVLFHRGSFYGYADYVDSSVIPEGDPKAGGTWRRGFMRLDPERRKLDLLHEMPVDSGDGEYATYYYYDRRPYVAELGGKVYVLRFTDPWTLHRVTRRGLRQIGSGADDDSRAHSIQAWNGRLYVLTSRVVIDEEAAARAATPAQPATPAASAAHARARLELKQAIPVVEGGWRRWTLHEIEPGGAERRQVLLPTSAERVRLVPGHGFWTAIEENSIPNVGQESGGTSFLFLPAAELLAGAFSCRSEARPSTPGP